MMYFGEKMIVVWTCVFSLAWKEIFILADKKIQIFDRNMHDKISSSNIRDSKAKGEKRVSRRNRYKNYSYIITF